jgi:PAS domain S-box-containing protein
MTPKTAFTGQLAILEHQPTPAPADTDRSLIDQSNAGARIAALTAPSLAEQRSTKSLRVLLFDNDPIVATTIEQALGEADLVVVMHRVETLKNLGAALHSSCPDIVIAEISHSHSLAHKALSFVRRAHPEIPVVIIGRGLDDEAATELLKSGAKDYVPSDHLWRLGPAVRRAIEIEHGIRARKDAEQALRSANELLRATERLGHIGAFEWDIVADTVVWSDETYRIHGKTPGQFTPNPEAFFACVHPDDRKRVTDAVAATVEENEPFNLEFRIVRQDGSERTLHTRGEVTRAPSGKPLRLTGTSRDITEWTRTKQELAFQRSVLATEHELSPDGILVIGPDRKIISVNRRFSDIFRVPTKLLDTKDDALVLEYSVHQTAYPDKFLARVHYLYNHVEETSFDEIALKDGRILERYSAPMRLDGQNYVGRVWFFRDITERKESERSLLRTNRALRTLSNGNEVLFRAASEVELLREMCRTIVEAGGYRMAWIGVPEQGAENFVRPAAYAGKGAAEFTQRLHLAWNGDPRGDSTVARAIRTGEQQTVNNVPEDPGSAQWAVLAREHDIASITSLPLKIEAKVVAVLVIYGTATNAFDGKELSLMDCVRSERVTNMRR